MKALIVDRLVGRKLEGQVVSARPDELDEGLEAGRDGSLLPARDNGPVAAGPLGELRLGEARS